MYLILITGFVGLLIGFIIRHVSSHSREKLQDRQIAECKELLSQSQTELKSTNETNNQLKISVEKLKTQLESDTKSYQRLISEKENIYVKLDDEKQTLKNSYDTILNALSNEKQKTASLEKELEKDRNSFTEKLALLNDSEKKLKESFENLANSILEKKSKDMNEKQNEQMNQILKPLKEQIETFRTRIETVHTESKTGQELLKSTIDDLKKINMQISEDARNLTNALKHDSKTQGSWGEMLLESILENSGLRNGYEYSSQESFTNEEGKRLRPDIVVKLPNQKYVVIDSKVSLTAYERYVSSTDSIEKNKALNEHILSIKKHIRELTDKHYENLHKEQSLDFVLLFIPIESAFLTAIEADREMFSNAYDAMIVMVCPSTLMTTLKTIYSLWNYEYRNQNAFKIAEEAGKLYDKFVGFIEDMNKIKNNIDNLNVSYENAMAKLSKGRGNLVNKAEQLRVMGAKTKKSMDNQLLEISDKD